MTVQTQDTPAERAKVIVTFTKGSTKDGPVGHHVHVEEGADREEAIRVFDLAAELHLSALKVDSN